MLNRLKPTEERLAEPGELFSIRESPARSAINRWAMSKVDEVLISKGLVRDEARGAELPLLTVRSGPVRFESRIHLDDVDWGNRPRLIFRAVPFRC